MKDTVNEVKKNSIIFLEKIMLKILRNVLEI